MRVFILKEGKEYNQGVDYLDDGTMVVVDNARKMIGKTIDVSVTSVLQTTAGKMIFGKWDERSAGRHDSKSSASPVPVSASTGTGGSGISSGISSGSSLGRHQEVAAADRPGGRLRK